MDVAEVVAHHVGPEGVELVPRGAEAVRLLGAQTILTGITAQVSRTIVQLGVDITTMHTLSRLAEGIELALSFVGRSIQKTKKSTRAKR